MPSHNKREQDNFIIWAREQGKLSPELKIYDPLRDSKLKGLYTGLGADRVAKLDAARVRYPKRDIILFDFGTATTVSVANAEGEFLGGFIALGFAACLEALGDCSELPDLSSVILSEAKDLHNAAKGSFALRAQDDNWLGKSTDEAILKGTVLAHNALIDSWLELACEVTNDPVIIATGGQREIFAAKFEQNISAAKLFN